MPSLPAPRGHFSLIRIDETHRLISRYVSKERITPGDVYRGIHRRATGSGWNRHPEIHPREVPLVLKVSLHQVPGDYRHAEGDSDDHNKASLMGFSLMIPIIDGHLALGTWQALYVCEFDGPRHRHVLVGITSE